MDLRWFIDKVTLTSDYSLRYLFEEKNKIYSFVNAFKYGTLRKTPLPFQRMDGLFIDGIFLCKIIKILWRKDIPRRSFDMTSIAKQLFSRLNNSDETIYFIGDEESMISRSVIQFQKAYPKMRVLGYRNGFFNSNKDRVEAMQIILNQTPDYVVVGMGGKLQEEFAYGLKNSGYKGIVFTCGGFFHQAVKTLYYYPEWVNKYNLRAPYRMLKERTYKRLWNILFIFPFFFTFDTICTKLKNNNRIWRKN